MQLRTHLLLHIPTPDGGTGLEEHWAAITDTEQRQHLQAELIFPPHTIPQARAVLSLGVSVLCFLFSVADSLPPQLFPFFCPWFLLSWVIFSILGTSLPFSPRWHWFFTDNTSLRLKKCSQELSWMLCYSTSPNKHNLAIGNNTGIWILTIPTNWH